jgi:hypothetical protein
MLVMVAFVGARGRRRLETRHGQRNLGRTMLLVGRGRGLCEYGEPGGHTDPGDHHQPANVAQPPQGVVARGGSEEMGWPGIHTRRIDVWRQLTGGGR